MTAAALVRGLNVILGRAPVFFLAVVCMAFGVLSPRFLTLDNLAAILVQSSWLIVVALGMNFVLLTAGVDLSVGAAMYLAAVTVGMGCAAAPVWVAILAAVLVGTVFGGTNGLLVTRYNVPPFIGTLATMFIGRGLGLYFSSTKEISAGPRVAELGSAAVLGLPVTLWIAAGAGFGTWLAMRATEFGTYVRAIGADREAARRADLQSDMDCLCIVRSICRAGGLRVAESDCIGFGGIRGQCGVSRYSRGGPRWDEPFWRSRRALGTNGWSGTHHDDSERHGAYQCEPLRVSCDDRCCNFLRGGTGCGALAVGCANRASADSDRRYWGLWVDI